MHGLSIPTRLIALAGFLLAALVVSNLVLNQRLSRGVTALEVDALLVENLHSAIDASKAFGDLKYWLLELAVNPRPRSESNARESHTAVGVGLDRLGRFDPEAVAVLRLEVGALMDTTLIAIEAYREQELARGDEFLAKGLDHIRVVDRRLGDMVHALKTEVADERERVRAGAVRAADLSMGLVVVVTLFALAFTTLIVRSITVPLRRLVASMTAITGGDLEAPVPAAGRDEIGAMTRTLSLLRDHLVERKRLLAEQRRAEEAERLAQRRLVDALESISEGFALYDAEDRLVMSNTRYREMLFSGNDELTQPGTAFEDIIRGAARAGLIVDAIGDVERWLYERIAAHHAPGDSHIQQRSDGTWVRVTERSTHEGGIVVVYTDITELMQRDAELSAILDAISYGVVFADRSLRVRVTNQAFRDMWDIPEAITAAHPHIQELIEYNRDNDVYPVSREAWDDYVAERVAAIRGGAVPPSEQRRNDGKVYLYQVVPLPNGARMLTYFDISQLKRVEEALRRSEERYALALEGASEVMWDWDTASDRLVHSSRALTMFGCSSLDFQKPADWVARVHPDDRDSYLALLREHLRGGSESFTHEYRVRHADGRYLWVLHRGRGQRDENGHVYRMAGSIGDITARKEAEIALRQAKLDVEAAHRQLREREARLRDFIEAASDWTWETDADHRLVFVSEKLQEIANLKREALLGGTLSSVLTPEMVPDGSYGRYRDLVELAAPFKNLVVRYRDDDGATRHTRLNGMPFLDASGEFAGYRGTGTDVTGEIAAKLAVEQTQRALADSEARFRDIVEASSDWIWETDADYRFVSFSAGLQSLSGEDPDRVRGTTRMDMRLPDDTDDEKWERHAADVAARRPFRDFEFRYRDDEGNIRVARVNGTPFYDEAGAFAGYRGIGTDITAEVEAKLAIEIAEQRDRIKSQFLASMSHELRTPLNAIIGYTRLVARHAGDRLPERQRDNLEKILVSAEHLLNLINEVLDLSKIEAGRMEVTITEGTILPLAEQCLRTVEPLLRGERVRLLNQVPDTLPALRTDHQKLRQILINLLSNAAKFTEDGTVALRGVATDDGVELQVRDTGTGIPSENLSGIFEEFRQAGDSTGPQRGTGLGLAIARRLARLLGGDIRVESAPGEGSTFTVTLPLNCPSTESRSESEARA